MARRGWPPLGPAEALARKIANGQILTEAEMELLRRDAQHAETLEATDPVFLRACRRYRVQQAEDLGKLVLWASGAFGSKCPRSPFVAQPQREAQQGRAARQSPPAQRKLSSCPPSWLLQQLTRQSPLIT